MANNETAILKVALQLSTTNFRKQFNAAISRTSNALSKELTIQKKLLDIESKKSIVNTNRAKAQSAYTASLRQVALLEKSIQDKKRSALMLERQTGINQEKHADGAPAVQWKSAGYLDPKKVQEVQKLASRYNVLKDSLGRLAPATKAAQKRLYDYQNTITYTNKEMKQLIRSTKRIDFGFLSMIFGGMALQRTFGGALKSIITDFNRITESQTAFGLATRRVNASFNYLKFAIGNALNNPLVINAMDWIIDRLEYLADVVDEHPMATVFVLAGMGATFLLGTLLLVAGQTMSIGIGIYTFGRAAVKVFSLIYARALTCFEGIGAAVSSSVWVALGALAILATGFAAVYSINNKHLNDMGLSVSGVWNNIQSITATFLAGIANIFVLTVTGIINLFILIPSFVSAIFAGMVKLAYNFGKGLISAIIAGFKGEDISDAFFKELDFDGIIKSAQSVFDVGLENAFKVTEKSNNITDSISNWEYSKQIDWADATVTNMADVDAATLNLMDSQDELSKLIETSTKDSKKNFEEMSSSSNKEFEKITQDIKKTKKELEELTSRDYVIKIRKEYENSYSVTD